MDDTTTTNSRLRGYTPSGCKITLVSSRRSGKIAHLKNYLDTSSQSKTWGKNLSPFLVGPVDLYDGMLLIAENSHWWSVRANFISSAPWLTTFIFFCASRQRITHRRERMAILQSLRTHDR